jgi:uncharacterized repeat protein (TIGR01451 family)
VQSDLVPLAAVNTLTTITEADLGAEWSVSANSWLCADQGNGNVSVGTFDAVTRTFTIPAADVRANSQIQCHFFNTRVPTVTVTKVSNGGTGTFSFTGTNGVGNHSIMTTTAGTGVAGAQQTLTNVGTSTTITELAPPAGFALQSITCSGLGAGGSATPTINGTAGGNVVLDAAATAAGSNIACTFTNASTAADLSITKSNGVTSLTRGSQTTYTVTVSNGGPAAADNAVVRDTPVSELSACSVQSCTPTASCPASTGDLLTTAGATLRSLAANSSVVFTVQCTVN